MTIQQVYIKGFNFLCIIIVIDLQFQYGMIKNKKKLKQNETEKD